MNPIGSILSVKMLAIAAAACAVAVAIAGATGYIKGHSAGVDKDKQRSDLVIAMMLRKAQVDLDAANVKTRALGAELQATKEKAENDLQAEQARNRRVVAAAAADSGRMQRYITDFASGVGTVNDSLATCRADAGTLGVLLDEALRAHAERSGEAEQEAGTARALLRAWPRTGSVFPQVR